MSGARKERLTIAFNMRPRRGPWGGGNQWVRLMIDVLRWHGWRVVFCLDERVDCVFYTHAGLSGELSFGVEDVSEAKRRNSRLRCVHRINDNDIRKGTEEMDSLLARTDAVADATVFVSEWLRDYHAARWFKMKRPHRVIRPGADPRVFHPFGVTAPQNGPVRIVTHHWSDNMAKGFDVYSQIDELISNGKLAGHEFWVIGRWPKTIKWKTARTFSPCSGIRLARLLKACHIYVSASRYEPGAMHVAEGLQCGLPLLYTRDTGGTAEQGEQFGVLLGDDIAGAVEEITQRRSELRTRIFQEGPCGLRMCREYIELVKWLVARDE